MQNPITTNIIVKTDNRPSNKYNDNNKALWLQLTFCLFWPQLPVLSAVEMASKRMCTKHSQLQILQHTQRYHVVLLETLGPVICSGPLLITEMDHWKFLLHIAYRISVLARHCIILAGALLLHHVHLTLLLSPHRWSLQSAAEVELIVPTHELSGSTVRPPWLAMRHRLGSLWCFVETCWSCCFCFSLPLRNILFDRSWSGNARS